MALGAFSVSVASSTVGSLVANSFGNVATAAASTVVNRGNLVSAVQDSTPLGTGLSDLVDSFSSAMGALRSAFSPSVAPATPRPVAVSNRVRRDDVPAGCFRISNGENHTDYDTAGVLAQVEAAKSEYEGVVGEHGFTFDFSDAGNSFDFSMGQVASITGEPITEDQNTALYNHIISNLNGLSNFLGATPVSGSAVSSEVNSDDFRNYINPFLEGQARASLEEVNFDLCPEPEILGPNSTITPPVPAPAITTPAPTPAPAPAITTPAGQVNGANSSGVNISMSSSDPQSGISSRTIEGIAVGGFAIFVMSSFGFFRFQSVSEKPSPKIGDGENGLNTTDSPAKVTLLDGTTVTISLDGTTSVSTASSNITTITDNDGTKVVINPDGTATKITQVQGQEVEKPLFFVTLQEQDHGDHSHPELKTWKDLISQLGVDVDGLSASQKLELERQNITNIKLMGQTEEGCPCCMIGLDLDEIAAAFKVLASTNSGDSHLYGWVDLSSGTYWAITPFVLFFAILGGTAGYRNIKGTIKTWNKLSEIINSVDQEIKKRERQPSVMLDNLKALRATLGWSRLDSEFNFIGPGLLNLMASVTSASTVVYHHPWAPLPIGVYATFQACRTLCDFLRVKTWAPILDETYSDLANSGVTEFNDLRDFQLKWYAISCALFSVFSIGSFLVLNSLFCIEEQGSENHQNEEDCHTDFYVGLALFFLGAISTTIVNNIIPRMLRFRNIITDNSSRFTATVPSSLETLARLASQDNLLSPAIRRFNRDHNTSSCSNVRTFLLKILTAFPDWPIQIKTRGEKGLHKLNESFFNQNKDALIEKSGELLIGLEKLKNPDFQDNITLENKIYVLQSLGVLSEVIMLFLEQHHADAFNDVFHCHDGECSHDGDEPAHTESSVLHTLLHCLCGHGHSYGDSHGDEPVHSESEALSPLGQGHGHSHGDSHGDEPVHLEREALSPLGQVCSGHGHGHSHGHGDSLENFGAALKAVGGFEEFEPLKDFVKGPYMAFDPELLSGDRDLKRKFEETIAFYVFFKLRTNIADNQYAWLYHIAELNQIHRKTSNQLIRGAGMEQTSI